MSNPDDYDIAGYWKDVHAAQKVQRVARHEAGVQALRAAGVIFTEHNYGTHLIVEGPSGFIDYWPSTSKWCDRADKKMRFGLQQLLKHLKVAA